MIDASGAISYLLGDATRPVGSGRRVLVHCVNDGGRWGKGFVLAISSRWPEPEADYRAWAAGGVGEAPFALGRVRFVPVESELWVANLIGQHGLRAKGGVPPIRYEALREGLARVAEFAEERSASVHLPRIGCGLAGGTWDRVEPILRSKLVERGIDVFVYDPRPNVTS